MAEIDDALLGKLRQLDTPTVCNALEVVVPERRGYGYTTQALVCTRPEIGSDVCNSNEHMGLGCIGVITDGSVRDIPDIADGFQMMANRIGPSHAYVHPVEYGCTVTVAGMRVVHGDLIHADQHGAVVIPREAAAAVPDAAAAIARRERVVIEAAREEGFNIERLRKAWGQAAKIH